MLAWPGGPTVAELGAAGVSRISVGGAFAYAALGAVVEAAEELLEPGTLRLLGPRRRRGPGGRATFERWTLRAPCNRTRRATRRSVLPR